MLPSTVDDIDFGITHVIRGEDHVANTAAQIQMFEALGRHAGLRPSQPDRRCGGPALSKRDRSISIQGMREEGIEALAVASYAATIGTSDPVAPHVNLDELVRSFDFAKLSRAPARFDPAELRALNAKLLQMLPFAAVAERLEATEIGGGEAFWEAVRGNLAVLGDAKYWWEVVQGPLAPVIESRELCHVAAGLLPPEPWDTETWASWSTAVKEATGARVGPSSSPCGLLSLLASMGPSSSSFYH